MKQMNIIGAVGTCCAFITFFLYYRQDTPKTTPWQTFRRDVDGRWNKFDVDGTPMRHVPYNVAFEAAGFNDTDVYQMDNDSPPKNFINTRGCRIPFFMEDLYDKYEKSKNKQSKNKQSKSKAYSCGKRAVLLTKISRTNRISVFIKDQYMSHYLKKARFSHCCYQYILRSTQAGFEEKKIEYTPCIKIEDGDKFDLEADFININCYGLDMSNKSMLIYNDAFPFIRKINSSNINPLNKYNVLMIGMDSMSGARTVLTMPRMIRVFKENNWLNFQAYNKIGDNTFPNLMAALTGQNISTINKLCSGKMDDCNDIFIWSAFKKAGYVTAYGEDYLRLPDTFSGDFKFKRPPTDHYMRPFFLDREVERYNKNLVCTGTASSGQQLLDYAFDFANTYREDRFFGLFWMNSFSHNANSLPSNADKLLDNFFNKLSYIGVLYNTFIIFFSDHGVRFGDVRMEKGSFYDDRLPALFVWTPMLVKDKYLRALSAAVQNQHNLVTPYDLYNTFVDIIRLPSNKTLDRSKGCPNCVSLYRRLSQNRTCAELAIHEKWCSCRTLYPLLDELDGTRSVVSVVAKIDNMVKIIRTKPCWTCKKLDRFKIIRMHFYFDYHTHNLYHVVAFTLAPGNMSYEATVSRDTKGTPPELVGPISVISPYKRLGSCAIEHRDRLFCVCQKTVPCTT